MVDYAAMIGSRYSTSLLVADRSCLMVWTNAVIGGTAGYSWSKLCSRCGVGSHCFDR